MSRTVPRPESCQEGHPEGHRFRGRWLLWPSTSPCTRSRACRGTEPGSASPQISHRGSLGSHGAWTTTDVSFAPKNERETPGA
jgi:hypothetical protein